MNIKKIILPNLPYVLFIWIFDKVGQAFRLAGGADLSAKVLNLGGGFSAAFESLGLSLHPIDLLVGVAGAVIIRLVVYFKGKNAKKYRQGMEYGSAHWGTAEDIKPYTDPAFENNIILTQTERITMSGRPKQPKYARNKNIMVIGGSGSGKTRFFCKPNLMQCTSKEFPVSYVVTDPKGTILVECGKLLQRSGYRIKALNTINFKKSMHYNPFAYIRSEKDILKLTNTIIMNTKGDGEKAGEDFWVKAERLLYSALIGYIWYEAPTEEKNFIMLLELINASEAKEDDDEYQSPVDLLFERLEEKDPEHFAVRQYKKFLLSAGKTRSSILISCGARLAPFDIKELRDLMEYDELELDTLGDRKTALFLIMSDTDTTFNFVIAILQSQLFNLLCDKADDEYRVMSKPDDVELSEDEKLEMVQDLAFDLDEFFRQKDPQYAAAHSDAHAGKELIADLLMEGKTAAIKDRLAEMAQTPDDELAARIGSYEQVTGYEAYLDNDVPAIREKLEQAQAPDGFLTGEKIETPRGSFSLADMTKEQIEAAGYGYHHSSDDGMYHIMGNGTRAFAIRSEAMEQENHLKNAEMAMEDDYGMIDGIINNGPKEVTPPGADERTSIRDRLTEARRECAERKPPEVKKPERNGPEHDL